LQLAPSTYLKPSEYALVTAVTSKPKALPHAQRSLKKGSPIAFNFTTEVATVPPGKLRSTDDPLAEAMAGASTHSMYPTSTWANAAPSRISESCKFNPDEQQRLLRLREQLGKCEAEMRELCGILQGASSGLPLRCEKHRSYCKDHVFSVEDARRELCHAWLLERLVGYIDFVDHALEDRLDPEPGGGIKLPATARRAPASPKAAPVLPTRANNDACLDASLEPLTPQPPAAPRPASGRGMRPVTEPVQPCVENPIVSQSDSFESFGRTGSSAGPSIVLPARADKSTTTPSKRAGQPTESGPAKTPGFRSFAY